MKKIAISLLSLALIGSVSYGQTNQVLSRNAVGYVKIHIPASGGFNLVSLNFDAIGGTNTTLNDILATQLRKNNNPTFCDKVYVFDRTSQSYLQFAVRASDTQFHNTASFAGAATNPVVPSGQAFWLQSPGSAATDSYVYVMGEVPDFGTNVLAILGSSGGTLQQIGNPFPVDMNINSLINSNDGARANNNPTFADRLYLWDQSSSTYVQLGLRASDNSWHYTTNYAGAAPTLLLSPGAGAWYQGKTNFTWSEIKPYTYP